MTWGVSHTYLSLLEVSRKDQLCVVTPRKKGVWYSIHSTVMISGCVVVFVISLLSGPNAHTLSDTV